MRFTALEDTLTCPTLWALALHGAFTEGGILSQLSQINDSIPHGALALRALIGAAAYTVVNESRPFTRKRGRRREFPMSKQ